MMNKEKYLTEPSDNVRKMLLEVKSPCVFNIGETEVYMSCEEIIGWLRKKYDIVVSVNYMSLSSWATNDMFEYCVRSKKHKETICGSTNGYENALNTAIERSLNIIKTWEEQ